MPTRIRHNKEYVNKARVFSSRGREEENEGTRQRKGELGAQ